jgi:hypothetical protein
MLLHDDEAVGRHRHGIDPAFDQEFGEVGMVARRLPAQPDLGSRVARGVDDCRVALNSANLE